MKLKTFVYALLTVVALSACARNEVERPTEQLGDATQAMERAAQANAYEFAAFEMANADRKLATARDLSRSDEDKDRREAARLAEQVTVDARLAEAKARLAQANSINAEAKRTLEALRKEAEPDVGATP